MNISLRYCATFCCSCWYSLCTVSVVFFIIFVVKLSHFFCDWSYVHFSWQLRVDSCHRIIWLMFVKNKCNISFLPKQKAKRKWKQRTLQKIEYSSGQTDITNDTVKKWNCKWTREYQSKRPKRKKRREINVWLMTVELPDKLYVWRSEWVAKYHLLCHNYLRYFPSLNSFSFFGNWKGN